MTPSISERCYAECHKQALYAERRTHLMSSVIMLNVVSKIKLIEDNIHIQQEQCHDTQHNDIQYNST